MEKEESKTRLALTTAGELGPLRRQSIARHDALLSLNSACARAARAAARAGVGRGAIGPRWRLAVGRLGGGIILLPANAGGCGVGGSLVNVGQACRPTEVARDTCRRRHQLLQLLAAVVCRGDAAHQLADKVAVRGDDDVRGLRWHHGAGTPRHELVRVRTFARVPTHHRT